MDEIKTYFDKSMKKFSESLLNSIRSEIAEQIEALKENVRLQVHSLKKELDDVNTKWQHKVMELEDTIERNKRANQVSIRNIPVTDGENLHEIFKKISVVIGYDKYNDAPHIFRIPAAKHSLNVVKSSMRNRLRSQVTASERVIDNPQILPVIIVSFTNTWQKSNFMKCYFIKKSLVASEIGFTSTLRIYIGDNLTKHNAKLYGAAINLKKKGYIQGIRIVNGCVLVSSVKDNMPIRITQLADLEQFSLNMN